MSRTTGPDGREIKRARTQWGVWTLKTPPADYLRRYPNGKSREHAKGLIAVGKK